MKSKKQNMLSAVRLWAISQGMDEISDDECYNYHTDIGFKSNDKVIGFITETDKSAETLKLKISVSKGICDYIYIDTDDIKKNKTIKDSVPSFCGVLCYSDPSGLGFEFRVLRKPQLILQ